MYITSSTDEEQVAVDDCIAGSGSSFLNKDIKAAERITSLQDNQSIILQFEGILLQ